MVAPPDNDVLWARSLHHAHGGSPALARCLPRRPRGRDPRRDRPARQRQDHAAALPVRHSCPEQGEVWFNSVPVHTLAAAGPRAAAPGPLRLDRPRAPAVPELNAWENAALPLLLRGTAHRAPRKKRRHGVAGPPRHRRRAPASAPARCSRPSASGSPSPAPWPPTPAVLFADEPTAPLHRADRAQVLRTLTTRGPLARHHRRARHPRPGGRRARRPHASPCSTAASRTRRAAPRTAEGSAACSLSV